MAEELQVLFVDDEESIRLTLPLMLETFGFSVVSAGTVAEALRLMSKRRFDVLISDMNIERPGDGFAVASAMRSTQPNAVRFILTGYPDVESALQALREEVDDYLIKPTEVEEIVAKIHSKLERRGHRQKVEQKRLSEVIKREQEYITEKWLELAKQDEILGQLKLPDPERKDHIPQLLDVAGRILEGKQITSDDVRVAAKHGQARLKQGYSAIWLVHETKLLQDAIAGCIQRNLLDIQISSLIPDMIHVFGIVQSLLEQSLTTLLHSEESQKETNRKIRPNRNKTTR
jgi:response regulator RpfG family c-di-GMP phosphodiesterase